MNIYNDGEGAEPKGPETTEELPASVPVLEAGKLEAAAPEEKASEFLKATYHWVLSRH